MDVLSFLGRVIRTTVHVVEAGILALLRSTRWLLNRMRL
jgi:hypothetical protein